MASKLSSRLQRPTDNSRKDPFCSSRLIFRAIEPDRDDAFLLQIQQSNISYQNFSCSLSVPKNTRSAEAYRKELVENRLLAVIVCLPGQITTREGIRRGEPTAMSAGSTDPIGILTMSRPDSTRHHHRRALIGLFILDEHQHQGYGSEAIRWSLQWGFESAGLHRVGIECVEWSEGLLPLYKKLGLKEEGTLRDYYWFQGKWWDYHMLGLLEDEWRAMRDETMDWKAK